MRRFWLVVASLLLAGQAHAETPDVTADLPPDLMANRLDDMGEWVSRCDDGKVLFCQTVSQNLAKSPLDMSQALAKVAKPACTGGNLAGCWQWGVSLAIRVVTDRSDDVQSTRKQDLVKATDLFRQACQGGSMAGCRDLARSYWWHRGVAEDKAQVLIFMQRACDGNLAGACFDLSNILRARYLGFDLDPVRGAHALMRSCELRDPKGCLTLADEIDNHAEVMTDWHGAPAVPDLYEMACKAHLASACNRLGEHYEQGLGVPVDDGRSAEYYRRSCYLDDAYGCSNLAGKIRDGAGVIADRPFALTLFISACQRYVPACAGAADLLSEGSPDTATQVRALAYYTKVCSSLHDCQKMLDLRARIIARHESPGSSKPILLPGPVDDYYPLDALRKGEEGRSITHFTVLPDGTTTNCTASGTTPTLDAAACTNIVAGLRYLPGTDAAGKPVAMEISSSVMWRIPKD